MHHAIEPGCIGVNVGHYLRWWESRHFTLLVYNYNVPLLGEYFAYGCRIGGVLLQGVAAGCIHIERHGVAHCCCNGVQHSRHIIGEGVAVAYEQYFLAIGRGTKC